VKSDIHWLTRRFSKAQRDMVFDLLLTGRHDEPIQHYEPTTSMTHFITSLNRMAQRVKSFLRISKHCLVMMVSYTIGISMHLLIEHTC
jgi:hypothetical protein